MKQTPNSLSYFGHYEDILAYKQNLHLGRGVNQGNALEATHEDDWVLYIIGKSIRLIADRYQDHQDSVNCELFKVSTLR